MINSEFLSRNTFYQSLKENENAVQEQLHFVTDQNATCKVAMTSRVTIGQIRAGLIGPHGVNVQNRVMVVPENVDDFAKTLIIAVETIQTMKWSHAMKTVALSTLAQKN